MGLGGFPSLGLANARKLPEHQRNVAANGREPVKKRETEERAAHREDISLAVLTADAFEARKAELKVDGKAGRWLSPLNSRTLSAMSTAMTPGSRSMHTSMIGKRRNTIWMAW
jgi:hypothetical protein